MIRFYLPYGKRLLDISASILALTLLAPLLLVVAWMIRREDGGRILFRQVRVGRRQQTFELWKFRSMRENVGDIPSASASYLPITKIGRIIRRTNVDELPQLVNILRGDMSIVGPRPALPSQSELISLRAASGVYEVQPGLTGLAQVSAYDGMSVREKAVLDGTYVRSISLVTDASLILRTFTYLRRPPPVY